jgi:Holliday junction resolvase RusA-like endonuclease
MAYEIWVPGRPLTKSRHRHGKGNVYTPQATREAETQIRDAWREADMPMFEGNVHLSVDFHRDKTRIHLWEVSDRSPLTGDIDNYCKLVLDALHGAAYKNDRCVMALAARKL